MKKNLTVNEFFDFALKKHQKNNLKIAEKFYKKILKINPNHVESIFLLGTLSAQIKNFDRARQLLSKVIQIHPNHVDACYNLGNVLKELGKYKEAVDSYKKAIQINPNYVDAHNNLGIVLKELRYYQKAIVCYEKAIQINPHNIGIYNNLGLAFKELGKLQKAISCFQKVIKLKPDNVEAYKNLAIIFKRQKKYKEAINTCLNSINEYGKNASIYNILGSIYYELNNKENAKKYFNKSIELEKGFTSIIARKYLGILGVLPFPQQDTNEFLQSYYKDYKHKGWEDAGDSKYYQGRTIIKNAFNSYFTLKEKISILDIGCGSGACGIFLQPHATKMDGVDLIKEFLELAAKKNIYSSLKNMDCIEYLSKKIDYYDLIIAAAVLLHFSSLEKIFSYVHRSLRDNGHFVFTVFFNDKTSIYLDAGNIFSHSHEYIKKICKKSNFIICKYSEHTHEIAYGTPKKARVYIVKRK